MTLSDLRRGFRDGSQRRLAQGVIMSRLADDRDQEECRYLMRLFWQLSVTYQEVTEGELREHVGPAKLAAVEEFIKAVRTSPDAVDAWIEVTVRTFPLVRDRGATVGGASPAEEDSGGGYREFRLPPEPWLPEAAVATFPGDEVLARAQAAYEVGVEGSGLELGWVLELRGDLPLAEAAYRLAGEAGDMRAFYALGRVLRARGAADPQVSAAWQSAADAGIVDAMYALAVLDADGGGGRPGRYLRRAAAVNHAPSCYALGHRAFRDGRYDEAVRWWTRASEIGSRTATEALEALRADLRTRESGGAAAN